jgi:hypothetical protein
MPDDLFGRFLVVARVRAAAPQNIVITVFAGARFQNAQNLLATCRRLRRPLDVKRFALFAENKLLVAIACRDAAEDAACLFLIGSRRKAQVSGVGDRVLDEFARGRRRHSHGLILAEKQVEEVFLEFGEGAELVKAGLFHAETKQIQQEEPGFRVTLGFEAADDQIAATVVKKIRGTKCFSGTLHKWIAYNIWR